MRMRKKASMQLSINAIVILVMAMAVLGIGLGLIRGVLAPAKDNLKDTMSKVDLSQTATSDNTIANLPQSIRMKVNKDNPVVVSYYNSGSDACASAATLNMVCGALVMGVTSLEVPVPIGTAGKLIANIKPPSGSGSVPCTVQVTCGSTTPVDSEAVFVQFSS